MTKTILPLISIIIGIIFGYGNGPNPIANKKSSNNESFDKPVERKEGEVTIKSANKLSTCITQIRNKGENFNLNPKEAEAEVFKYFDESLKDYRRPNEHNVYTQDAGPGKSAQNYDPRENNFVGFDINLNEETEPEEESNCKSPKFVKYMENADDPIVKKVFKNRFVRFENKEVRKSIFSHYLSFNYKYRHGSSFPWFKNVCNKKSSLILNHCLADSSLENQYEEFSYDESEGIVSTSIYCKSSNQKEWKLITTFSF